MSTTIKLDRRALCVRHAMAKDETRYNLCGIHLRKSDRGRIVLEATNGHILAKVELYEPFPDGAPLSEESTILSAEVVKALWTLGKCGGVEVVIDGESVTATALLSDGATPHADASMRFSARIVEGEYPKTSQVIPFGRDDKPTETLAQPVAFSCEYLSAAAKMGKEFGGKPGAALKFEGNGELAPATFEAFNPDVGELTIVIMPLRQ